MEFVESTTVTNIKTVTQTKTSASKGKVSKTVTTSKKETRSSVQKKSVNKNPKSAKRKSKAKTVEERVVEIEENLSGDMKGIQKDDNKKVEQLDILPKNQNKLVPISESDAKKNEEVQKHLADLLQGIEEMKDQDKADLQELSEIKGQLDDDITAASNDLHILITEKPDTIVGADNKNLKARHKAIRTFLLNTLNQGNEESVRLSSNNQDLRGKVMDLRERVRAKFLSDKSSRDDEEINDLLREYEDLLDQHAEVFKQLDEESNANVEEFEKYGDLWKQLFTEGMDLEKKCDDIDYEIEGLTDKEKHLLKLKDDLQKIYGVYTGKLFGITEQQRSIIEEIRNEIRGLEGDINSLKNQLELGNIELTAESQAFARGRNTKNEPEIEDVMGEFVKSHKARRRVQDDGEEVPNDWVQQHKTFINNSLSEFEAQKGQNSKNLRIQEILEQILQSNEDIERLLVDLQRIERERGVNEHKTILNTDMANDLADIRSRLEYELMQKERMLSELREYATGDIREQIDLLLREIQELRTFLREKWDDQQSELEDLRVEIENHRETLKTIITEIYNLKVLIIEEEHHNDIKRNLLRNRDEYIERLKISIRELSKKPNLPKVKFVPTKGDDIDALLADAMNQFGSEIPLTRLGGGFYLFGTRKIYAKIMNGRLVVRVGGGYMVIDEFLATYSDMELIRINKMISNEGVEAYEELKVYKKYRSENPEAFKIIDPNRRTILRSPTSKPKASERGRF